MIGGIAIKYRGPEPTTVKRKLNPAKRKAFGEIGRIWHRSMRPQHFTREGARKYGYLPRAGEQAVKGSKRWKRSYTGRKERKYGHRDPLVYTGYSRMLTRLQDVRASSTRARVVMRAPALNLQNPHSKIRMREELTTITDAEANTLVTWYGRHLDKELSRRCGSRTKRVQLGAKTMASGNTFRGYGVQIGDTMIGGISSWEVRNETEVRGETPSGEVYVRHQSVTSQKHGFSFTTTDVSRALLAMGTMWKAVEDFAFGARMYGRKQLNGGSFATGAVHRKWAIRKGMIIPRSLSVNHQGDVTLSIDVIATHDGTSNPPLIVTDNVALPSGLDDFARYSMSDRTFIGGYMITGKQSLSIDFGINVVAEGADSNIYDDRVSVRTFKPAVTIQGTNLEWSDETYCIPLLGVPCNHANTKIYLRRRAKGATFVGNETPQHMCFSGKGLAVIPQLAEGSGEDLATCSINLTFDYDGTNEPLVITHNTTIT